MPRGRTAITPEQRIWDLFAELAVETQVSLLAKLRELHDVCVIRDKRLDKKEATPKRRRAPAESDEQPPLLAAETQA